MIVDLDTANSPKNSLWIEVTPYAGSFSDVKDEIGLGGLSFLSSHLALDLETMVGKMTEPDPVDGALEGFPYLLRRG